MLKEKSLKTKAIIAVHFAGYPAKLKELQKLCKEYGLFLIEDAAHALGTKYDNTLIGTHGDVICFSFYATKNITTGEGGALVTKMNRLLKKLDYMVGMVSPKMHGIVMVKKEAGVMMFYYLGLNIT